jgi:hypothetical protein
MEPAEFDDCPVCERVVLPEQSHVKLVRAGEVPLYFHETCMTFGVLLARRDPLEARLGA